MAPGNDLFEGLPPPSLQEPAAVPDEPVVVHAERKPSPPPALAPPPALKSALKRPKPAEPKPEAPEVVPSGKRLRFKTTTDASEAQVIDAMKKIASHITNPAKLSKASKLAVQLIQAGSVKPGTRDYFFAILESAMLSPTACTDPSVRADYHALFSTAQDASEHLTEKQKNLLATWTIRAVVANDLFTDDSFVFSKAATRIKDIISGLPVATEDDDVGEAAALDDVNKPVDGQHDQELPSDSELDGQGEADPFGLDALIRPGTTKNDDKSKEKKEIAGSKLRRKEVEGKSGFLKSRREALIICLEIAARRYKTPWCQTVIDILVKHAFDNVTRFTAKQRQAIEKLWSSIREQQTWRKQGKSVSGKLDVNAFEWLQQKYANEKISIRRAVGDGGNRRAEQWLG
ncbi:hypothetical protein MLD38_018611 [Melastoma candidum]|uniref:Uncharacterized protein n=1 Tax=Melastoma candidum TaxID=119954 RepID=A0ACB9QW97_9MYRT|nr:hypothetical protein MLD38_018611 [Melastoma candidum]